MEKTWMSRSINSAHMAQLVSSSSLESAEPIFHAADQHLNTRFHSKGPQQTDFTITLSTLSSLPEDVVKALRQRCGSNVNSQGRMLPWVRLGKYTYNTSSNSTANSFWTFRVEGHVEFGRIDTIFSHRRYVGQELVTDLWFAIKIFSKIPNSTLDQWPHLGVSLRSPTVVRTVIVAPGEIVDRVAVIPIRKSVDAYVSIPW